MSFIDNADVQNMSVSEKNKFWLSLLKVGEKGAMVFEGVFFFILVASFIMSIKMPQNLILISIFLTSLLLDASAFIIYFLIELQRVSFCQFVSAIQTPTLKDDIWALGVSLAITMLAVFADKEGGTKFLNMVNKYDPVISNFEKDNRVKDNDASRRKLEKERDNKLKMLSCTECKMIEAKYNAKIAAAKSKLRKNENDAAWKQVENAKIRNQVSALAAAKESEIQIAAAKFEESRNRDLSTFDKRLFSLDTMQVRVKGSIDSMNNEELRKERLQIEQNHTYGGGMSYLTQIILLFCRFMQVWISKKDGKSFVEIGEFMRGVSIVSLPFEIISIFINELIEKGQINNQILYANAVQKIDDYKETKIGGDELRGAFVENKVSNFQQAKMLKAKMTVSQPHSYTVETVREEDTVEIDDIEEINIPKSDVKKVEFDEKDVILDIITQYETALDFCQTGDEVTEVLDIICNYKNILSYLNN